MANIWKLKNTSRVPPGGAYFYTQKETGVTLNHSNLPTLIKFIIKHREINKINVDATIDFEIEQSVCEDLVSRGHVNLCQEVEYNNNESKEMIFLKSKGASFVDDAAFQRRLDACKGNREKNIVRCPKWIESTDSCRGCQSCGKSNKLLQLSRKVVSTRCPLNKWK